MRESVASVFLPFTIHLEGRVPTMYLDKKGLVTVAIGDLIDPVPLALRLPFLRKDGSPATPVQIADEWARVKRSTDLIDAGWKAFAKICELHLSDAAISELVAGKLAENERELVRQYPAFEAWPADAQLATLSMAWACGADFGVSEFPRLAGALRAQDFDTAAHECRMREEGNPGIVPRNVANRTMYANAAIVLATGGDLDTLHYPTGLAASVPTVPDVSEETRDVPGVTSEEFPGSETTGIWRG